MPNETENHTLRLLQEMRSEIRKGLEDVNTRLSKAESERSAIQEQLSSIQNVVAGIAYFQADARTQLEALEMRMDRVEHELGLSGRPAE